MNFVTGPRPRFAAVLILATASVLFALHAYRDLGERSRIYNLRAATLGELSALRDEASALQSVSRLLEQNTREPADVSEAARKILASSVSLAVTNLPDQPLAGGWALRSVEILLPEVSPSEAGRLIEFLENQIPPWRLDTFEFRSIADGRGDARIVVQTSSRSAK